MSTAFFVHPLPTKGDSSTTRSSALIEPCRVSMKWGVKSIYKNGGLGREPPKAKRPCCRNKGLLCNMNPVSATFPHPVDLLRSPRRLLLRRRGIRRRSYKLRVIIQYCMCKRAKVTLFGSFFFESWSGFARIRKHLVVFAVAGLTISLYKFSID
jgi:hypothetical protein